MSRFVAPETSQKVEELMFATFGTTPSEEFLKVELSRYVPQLLGSDDEAVAEFVDYQRSVYIDGVTPTIGKPVASLNPTFIDTLDSIHVSKSGLKIYTRAAVKENGYRMQIHRGVDSVSAWTRQFTPYDLRMFPELKSAFAGLPLMIGDAELVSKHRSHLASFNTVQLRIPGVSFWPRRESSGLDPDVLEKYISDSTLFDSNGESLEDSMLTLSFHGLFAIAHPSTWEKPYEVQVENIISLCELPIDYERVDELLSQLEQFINSRKLNARVVERFLPKTHKQLVEYVEGNKQRGLEGTCIVQSFKTPEGTLVQGGRSVKVKTYETVDGALLGVYVRNKEDGCMPENITAGLIGLFDHSLGVYLPAMKVNLDPSGVQIKTEGQKERQSALRNDVVELLKGHVVEDGKIYTLYDTFLMEGKIVIKHLFKDVLVDFSIEEIITNLPVRSDLLDLFQIFQESREKWSAGSVKLTTVGQKFVASHLAFFEALARLDKRGQKRFFNYFSQGKEIKKLSAKLVKPQFVVHTMPPIVIETQVFDVKWGRSPYSAGFHSWYCESFCFNNVFAERVRFDKDIVTDLPTVHRIARVNTVKK